MRAGFLIVAGLVMLTACGQPEAGRGPAAAQPCRTLIYDSADYVVCTYDTASADIRLFHSDATGQPYRQFDTLADDMQAQDKTLVFAMNGGMYHEDRRPVGFYRDSYGDRASVNTNDGPGNFHMRPNGVFWLAGGKAGVTESQAYLDQGIDPDFASQSGPMLVIDGQLHPRLNPDGTSRKRRNGVGVSADSARVHFVISDSAVSFHTFASLFRDRLGAPNALFLDGQVSRLYAPALPRNEAGVDMGPIVGVVE